jgi:hypothetical protein
MYLIFSERGVLQQCLFDVAEHIHIGYCGGVVSAGKYQNNYIEEKM